MLYDLCMDTDPTPISPARRADKRQRQVRGMLNTCGLLHWYDTLEAWLADYADLARVVDDDYEAPAAAVTALLREACDLAARPSDEEFAAMLAGMDFLHYRILRTAPAPRPSFENAEAWAPGAVSLREFCVGHAIGGYRGMSPAPPPDVTRRRLLRALRQRRRHD